MIFVTLATEKMPFFRLLKWIDKGVTNGDIKDKVFIQTGSTVGYKFKNSSIRYKDWLTLQEMEKYESKSNKVVGHAGIGTFLTIMRLKKIPILVPRRHELGEHLDNHQLDFSREIKRELNIPIAYTYKDLIKYLNDDNLKIKIKSFKPPLIEHLESVINKDS